MIFYGILLLAFAIGSWVLPKFGTQFFVMSWVDNWGTPIGIAIRLAIGLVGVAMVIKGLASRRSGR